MIGLFYSRHGPQLSDTPDYLNINFMIFLYALGHINEMIRFSSYQLPVLDAGGQYLLFIIYYGRWIDIIEKTLGKPLLLTHRIYP